MTKPITIDFVSDISCPWCIIGLRALEEALARTADVVTADITFRAFELNPAMGPAGQNIVEHIAEKYGSTSEQSAANRTMIRERAGALGFTMAMDDDSRIYNTFDAHRLLHWAKREGKQAALKEALFVAYFTDRRDPSDHGVLVAVSESVGLPGDGARDVLESDAFAADVRTEERSWQSRGISSVPAIVVNERYLISGGQPVEAFEQALRGIAAEL